MTLNDNGYHERFIAMTVRLKKMNVQEEQLTDSEFHSGLVFCQEVHMAENSKRLTQMCAEQRFC